MINKVLKECRSYIGVKWKHQGRSRRGVDCVGFLLLALKSVDIEVLEIKGYARIPDGFALKKIMDEQPRMKKVYPPYEIGDILLLKIRKEPQHVAILCDRSSGNLGMIHSYNGGERKVVEHDFADYWKEKIVQAYRLI